MKKVVISGYYGFNNAGDEAVLASIIEALQSEIPEINITVLSNSPERTEKQYSVQAVDRWSLGKIIPVIRDCDLLISGGGSLLQDVTGAKSILYYLGVVRLALLSKKPVMFYAQGIGPVTRPWTRKILARVANKVDLITVRDQDSKDDLAEMGVVKPPVHVTADPVLGWEGSKGEDPLHVLCRAKAEDGRYAGISLRPWKGIKTDEIAAVCDFLAESGYQVVFLPFHFPGDIAVCREVSRLMQHRSCLIKENLSPGEIMDLVGQMDLVIGMRLHALIMAAARSVPFVALSYDPKVERFTSLVGQKALCFTDNFCVEDLKYQVEQILDNHSLIKKNLQEKTLVLKEKARENARLVKRLLEER